MKIYLADIPDYSEELERLSKLGEVGLSEETDRFLSTLFDINISPEMIEFMKIIVWAAIIILVGWLVYKEFILPELLKRKEMEDEIYEPQTTGMGTAADADIRGHRFEEELQKALHDEDYALAVRLRYLMSLKQLDNFKRIRWMEWKTPMMYVDELQADAESLDKLTHLFLYIKYGHYTSTREVYDEATALYNNLIRMGKGGEE